MPRNDPHPRPLPRAVVWAFLLLLLPAIAPAAAAQETCTHKKDNPAFYSQGNYKVRNVRLKSPIDFMHAISSALDAVRPQLPQPGSVFTLEELTKGREAVRAAMKALEGDDPRRSRVLLVDGDIEKCDEQGSPPMLDVYYTVFTTNYDSYLSHTFEVKQDELARPAASAATTAVETQKKGSLRVQPFVDYNRSRQLFGGGRLRLRAPGGVIDEAEVSAGGSTAGNEQTFELSGSRSPETTAVNELQYRLGYRHTDLPASANRLREGIMQAQLFGATKPLGPKGIILRYGASLEGGNQQTDLDAAAAAAVGSAADSGYGSLKTYLGATLRTKKYSLAGSYGLQLGTRGATADLDFVKHVGDVAFDAYWILNRKPGEFHSAVTLETRLSGGAIKTLGTLPLTQRFFGGNVARDFIDGDAWRIRGGPFIRSIPENRLDSGSVFGAVGGTGFYSANVTLGIPVWGKSLIPAEVAADESFLPTVNAAVEIAQSVLVFSHLSETPVFGRILDGLKPVDSEMAEIETALATLPWTCPNDPPDDRPEVEEETCLLKDKVHTIRLHLDLKDDTARANLLRQLDSTLKAGDENPDCMDAESCSDIMQVRVRLETASGLLRPAGQTQVADTFDRIRNLLATQQPPLVRDFNDFDDPVKNPDKQKAIDLAAEDMAQFTPVLDSFLYELNAFAVSPVMVFDAARVWPDRNGTRFGVGGGVRLSVVNLNLTLGYSFNPSPKPREGRGALFFSMDVTDLFR